MSQAVIDLYQSVISTQKQNADDCFSDGESKSCFVRCHNFLADIVTLRTLIAERPESYCLEVAENEYQFALSALINGHYRHSFGSLRLTFEMMLQAIYFSGHEVKLRQWLTSARDLTWGSLTDDNKGIFSAEFIKAFSPSLVDSRKKYSALAVTSYRECSEFVHGNPSVSDRLSSQLIFHKDALLSWESTMQSMRLVVLYCYLYRYRSGIGEAHKSTLDPIFIEAFGYEPAVQAVLEGEGS